MLYTARQVPDLRLAIADDWDPSGVGLQRGINSVALRIEDEMHNRQTDCRTFGFHQRAVRAAVLWFVNHDMARLALEAGPSMPADCTLTPEMLPDRNGLVVFEVPVELRDARDPSRPIPVRALHWCPFNNTTTGRHSLGINSYAHHPAVADLHPGPLYCGGTQWDLGTGIPPWSPATEEIRLLFAIFALAASPGVADSEMAYPDRAALRRSTRAGVDEDLTATRVIKLRTLRGGGGGETGHEYRHRWIVSGHWRSQPYGPGSKLRKPVFIAPHVKGPDGAPMLTGDRVKALVR